MSQRRFEPDRLDAFVTRTRRSGARAREPRDPATRRPQPCGAGSGPARRRRRTLAEGSATRASIETCSELAPGENSPLKTALAKFDALPRWQRLQSLLLEGEKEKLLARLGEKFDVQLIDIDGAEAKKIWQPTRKDSTLPASLPKPEGDITNLATGAEEQRRASEQKQERGAVVLFSDGQHNEGESPVEVAKILAGRGLPLFTVGFGSQTRPRDLAVVKVDAPDSVFFEDRIRGRSRSRTTCPRACRSP